jgi:hypothetical protein
MVSKYVSLKSYIAYGIASMGTQESYDFALIRAFVISMIQSHMTKANFMLVTKEVEVVDYRIDKPCDIQTLIAMEDVQCKVRMSKSNDSRNIATAAKNNTYDVRSNEVDELRSTFYYPGVIMKVTEDCQGNKTQVYGQTAELIPVPKVISKESVYQEMPSCFYTNKDGGSVRLHYLAYYQDEEGFPMVPDSHALREAVSWWIAHKMCNRGYKHPAGLNSMQCLQMYKDYSRKLSGIFNYPTIDQMEAHRISWNQMMPNLDAWSNFNNGSESLNYRGLNPNSPISSQDQYE